MHILHKTGYNWHQVYTPQLTNYKIIKSPYQIPNSRINLPKDKDESVTQIIIKNRKTIELQSDKVLKINSKLVSLIHVLGGEQ
jgi:hypothetical protein